MVIAERHKYILDQLKSAGYVSVAALSKSMNVTMVTVRKDLKILEDKGLLFRSHGSATPVAPYVMDKPVDEKQLVQVEQKRAIAQKAVGLLKEKEAIIIGSGTTVLAFAQAIPKELSLTILTGAMNVSIALLDLHQAEIVQLGGVVRKSSSSVVGHFAETMINNFACSKLFISVDGIDAEFGLTTSNMMEAHLNSTMIRSVQKTIVLADSSKFGKKSFGKIANLEDVDIIISDKALSQHYVSLLEDKGIEVFLV
ncbi:DeoR/GlpR family DNA-binding transcription regulator [Cyclobacterium sp.]|uniref:DeoR/GlpR family DNA-binding transcription regulator n=1 Tax=Cyclobacterium sp. TaxID=1966343 RepID=UPI0019AFB9A1|nr:DeoR/GlpR family DNA-binding transcription regulator [Cyclobacterium sp.]MBD3628684.1 DeoR/GlpR transcriptional regulator [Cyclobacterium sp.]